MFAAIILMWCSHHPLTSCMCTMSRQSTAVQQCARQTPVRWLHQTSHHSRHDDYHYFLNNQISVFQKLTVCICTVWPNDASFDPFSCSVPVKWWLVNLTPITWESHRKPSRKISASSVFLSACNRYLLSNVESNIINLDTDLPCDLMFPVETTVIWRWTDLFWTERENPY